MENLVTIDPTDHQNKNVDPDSLKKLLTLSVVWEITNWTRNLQFPDNPEKSFLFSDCQKANFFWCLLRYCSSSKQIVPSCTQLNISVHEGIPVLQSRIHYLDCIDSPATKPLQFTKYA